MENITQQAVYFPVQIMILLIAVPYSEQTARLFTALPTKNETRTIAPAIVTSDDFGLLRRGTAAVKMDGQQHS